MAACPRCREASRYDRARTARAIHPRRRARGIGILTGLRVAGSVLVRSALGTAGVEEADVAAHGLVPRSPAKTHPRHEDETAILRTRRGCAND